MFFGIDLSSSQSRPSACVCLGDRFETVYYGLLNSDRAIIGQAGLNLPDIIAIDAPLSLPLGLCCLEESCGCQPRYPWKGRKCERELARLGMPCYFTTKKSIIRQMVYRAMRLKGELNQLGYQVIEVYPYASKVRLFGKPIPSKQTEAGLKFLRTGLVRLIPSLLDYAGELNHDLCDAAVAAYTGFLYANGNTEALGDPEEGLIYIPAVHR